MGIDFRLSVLKIFRLLFPVHENWVSITLTTTSKVHISSKRLITTEFETQLGYLTTTEYHPLTTI